MKEFRFPLQKMNAEWKDLQAHHERGVLFFVLPQIDLLELGKAVAGDNKNYIMECLKEKTVFRAPVRDISKWKEDRVFSFIIVQPYVFVEYTDEHR